MKGKEIIKCAFCAGRGTNPFYKGTCPVCKGRGKNEIIVPFVVCNECKGNGKKSGTTLTCFECRGIGVVPDTREDIEKARSEIREIKKEMAQEVSELYGKINKKAIKTPRGWQAERSEAMPVPSEVEGTPPTTVKEMKRRKGKQQIKEKSDEFDNFFTGREASAGRYFCQSCAKEESLGSAYKVCEKCFFLYKFGEVREIKPEKAEKEENER